MPEHYVAEHVVRSILLADGPLNKIAERHGVSLMTVRLYKSLKSAKARLTNEALLREGFTPIVHVARRTPRRDFTPEQIADIRSSDDSSAKCAKRYGCTASMIRMIRTGRTYRET